jgi:aspartate-semialdehyde dehydrogenase
MWVSLLQLKTNTQRNKKTKEEKKMVLEHQHIFSSTLYISSNHKNTFVIYRLAMKTLMFCNFVFF